jgi:two-component system response regulator HydG
VAGMMACSSSMIEAVRLARAYARARDPVVLVGPTGSGKSRLARLIHEWSGRSGHLVEVSARELVESLSSDQLFGHEKGAFTDAIARRLGALASANSGSVLLDDAHLLQDRTQMLLLRALDSGYIRPHGSDRDVPIQVRLLVGTQRGLDELVREGALLPDFRYRLGFFEIRLGALRDRREDIAPLVEHFLSERAGELAAEPLVPGPGLVPMLQLAPWPGNVRELEQALRFADWRARGRAAEHSHRARGRPGSSGPSDQGQLGPVRRERGPHGGTARPSPQHGHGEAAQGDGATGSGQRAQQRRHFCAARHHPASWRRWCSETWATPR